MKNNTALLKTRYGKGWIANLGEGVDLTVEGGLTIEDGVIRLSTVDGTPGTYTNPTVTIDEFGRVTLAEDGFAPGIIPPATLDTSAEVAGYSGPAETLLVLDAGDGRSAIYQKDESGTFRGPAYITGNRGINGTNGTNGIDGAAGAQGQTGPQGPIGPEGLQGPRGLQGETGPRGSDGSQGAMGPQGPQGPEGPTGSVLTPDEYGNLDEDAIARIQTLNRRYFFLVNPSGDLRSNTATPSGIGGNMSLHLIGYSPVGGWHDYGQLTGAQGPRGLQGVQGNQGAAGPAGAQGPQGIQGPQGVQGERGLTGSQGPTGATGPAGANGTNGAQGPQGERGLQGLTGPAGPTGASGPAGEKGERGDSSSFRGAMYTVADSGARVNASTTFQPVDTTKLVYNIGGMNFRPAGTASNAFVVPAGVSMIRLSFGLAFINNNVVVDSAYHLVVSKNGSYVYPGSPSVQGKFVYTNARFSGETAVLNVETGDVLALMFATSTPAGQKTPTGHTYFSIEVIA